MCQDCRSDILDFDTDKALRQNPVKVPPFQIGAPYFSICPGCGLTYRAKAHVSTGILSSPSAHLTFKPWGSPCDFCHCAVSSHWPRVSIIDVDYGVLPRAVQPAPRRSDTLQTETGSFRAAVRKSSLLKSVTGSVRAVARLIASNVSTKEQGKSFRQYALDEQHLPDANRQRRRMDRDHNLPYGWNKVAYDGDTEQYTYQDQYGRLHRSYPGNQYGPWIDE
ncbi:hypothetical protein PMIN01_11272 [Paraphaeosphaeria minitans]|uniref:Uncharacterized protein n=1 Tax=Paraphaeosphaeria minitans TaxID=565426 RepID=A0A9P6KKE7_9PLEO|nr:hypothetical protein PMIN01_11272 [Paraphaeosphaeria minitans]